jgi:hypothetical protein
MGISSRDLVEDKAFKFKNRLEELKSEEYYSEEPKELISLFERVIKQTIESLGKIDEDDQIAIKRVNTLLTFYHYCLDEIEHVGENNVPVEILPLIERILNKLNIKTTFVFRPSPLYNYSYYPISKIIGEIMISQKYQPVEGKEIVVVSFPSCERNSALLSCNLAHEIGHHLNESFSIAREIEPKILEILDKDYLNKYVTKFIESLSPRVTLDKFYPRDQLIPMFTEEFAGILRKWLDEIVSDIIALYLFGPSFVFALSEFSLSSQDVDKYSETHPPLFIRLKNLMELFGELKLLDNLKQHAIVKKKIEHYTEISQKSFETTTENKVTITNIILERGIVKLFELARGLVKAKINPKREIYDVEDCEKAISLFRNLIPANEVLLNRETSRPIDPISILNAAWIVRINFIDDLYAMLPKNGKVAVRNILDELTLKALDLQEFHTRMGS